MGPEYKELKALVRREGLHTVCEEAGCPNIFECWEDREATFLIGGEQCTRRCDFCQIDTGKPAELDRDEPRRVAESVQAMGLRYSTVTGVARDDLPDGGAWLYAETVRAIKKLNPNTGVELLIPDFNGEPALLEQVFEARPEVLAHNVETVPRIFKRIRPAFRYERSLAVLTAARDYGLVTKSNLILGMGETPDEVRTALRDLLRRRLRHRHHHPVPAAVAAPPPGGALGQARGVRRARAVRCRRSASPACWPVRWFGRRTERAGSTRRPRSARPSGYRAKTPYPEPVTSLPAEPKPRLRPQTLLGVHPVVSPSRPTAQPRPEQKSRVSTDKTLEGAMMAKSRNTAAAKAAKAEAKAARKAASKQRRSQLWQAFQIQRKEDKRLLPYMIGAFVLIVAASVAAGIFAGGFTVYMMIPLGVVLGALVAFIIFGRRAQKSVYRKAEGQTGAAAWALDNLRGKWRVTPGVAATGHFDAVHRVIGRPGVIFVGEGSATRVKPLLAQEKKRTARLVGDIPIYDVVIGNGEGEVPLAKLERHLNKLPANITVKQMDSLESRLAALGTKVGPAAMPKGPLPTQAKMRGVQRTVRQALTTAGPPRCSSAVLQPAQVGVGDQRRDDQRDQQPAHQRPAESDVQPAVDGHHHQAERELAGREPEQPHRHRAQHEPDDQDGAWTASPSTPARTSSPARPARRRSASRRTARRSACPSGPGTADRSGADRAAGPDSHWVLGPGCPSSTVRDPTARTRSRGPYCQDKRGPPASPAAAAANCVTSAQHAVDDRATSCP